MRVPTCDYKWSILFLGMKYYSRKWNIILRNEIAFLWMTYYSMEFIFCSNTSALSQNYDEWAHNNSFQNEQKKIRIGQKKVYNANFFYHMCILPFTMKFHEDFKSLKKFLSLQQKIEEKWIFWELWHARHLFTAHMFFMQQITISVAHSSFGQQFSKVSWHEMHIHYFIINTSFV